MSGSTFVMCHALLTPFWLPHILLSPKTSNEIWLPIEIWNFNFLWSTVQELWEMDVAALLKCVMSFWRPFDSPTFFWVPKLVMKSGFLSKYRITTFYDQRFRSYEKWMWQHFWNVPHPFDTLLTPFWKARNRYIGVEKYVMFYFRIFFGPFWWKI